MPTATHCGPSVVLLALTYFSTYASRSMLPRQWSAVLTRGDEGWGLSRYKLPGRGPIVRKRARDLTILLFFVSLGSIIICRFTD
jgi:hypothetical protein